MSKLILAALLAVAIIIGLSTVVRKQSAQGQVSKYLKAFGILLALFIIVILPMILFSGYLTAWEVFKFGVDSFVSSVGMPIWLARGVIALVIVPFLWALGKTFSFNGRARGRGTVVVAVYIAAYCMAMYMAQRGTYFRHDTGVATKWYCPADLRTFDTDGYDPNCGTKLEPVTSEIAQLLAANRSQEAPVLSGAEYFDPRTGVALKWYWQAADGSFELFDQPGFHPRYKEPLRPVTPQIVKAIEGREQRIAVQQQRIEREVAGAQARADAQSEAAAFKQRYVRALGPRSGDRPTILLEIGTALSSAGASVENAFSEQIAQALAAEGFTVRADAVREAAYADGIVERLSNNDASLFGRLGLADAADYLVLCARTFDYAESPKLTDQLICSCRLAYKVIDVKRGRVHAGSVKGTGLGSTREQAAGRCTGPVAAEIAKTMRSLPTS